MLTLVLIGLIGGLITGVSPCVLPMLPILFVAGSGGNETSGRWARPLLIISGLVVSFSLITLLGSTILSALGLPDDFLRWASIVILAAVGVGMLIPAVGHLLERPFYRLPKFTGGKGGPFVLGLALGTLYVPCAGPILAAITVAGATGNIGPRTVVLDVAFAVGAAIPLLVFAAAGSNMRQRINAYRARATAFRIGGGIALIALAVALAFNLPQVIQRHVPGYTAGVEKRIANSKTVNGALTPNENTENKALSRCTPGDEELASCGRAPALRETQRWFNTPGDKPLTLDGLRGKVVLLDFFAYSCINCQRDQPFIQKWYETYRGDGFVVVGIHSPEFAFEKSAKNLASSLKREGTTYPVVQDNELANFRAYRNRYWPAKYLIDAEGTVRAIRFGEGDYQGTESLIRSLLEERNSSVDLPGSVTKENDVDAVEGRTPETYLAHNKKGYVGTPKYAGPSQTDYTLTARQPVDTYSLGGRWTVTEESISPLADGSRVRLHFRGRKVFHVLSGRGTVKVSIPGRRDRTIKVSGTPNLYTLVSGSDKVDKTMTLTYSKGVTAYTFTFG